MASRKTPARGGSSKTPARKAATTAKGAAGKSTDRTAGKSAGKTASKSAKTTAARAARRNTDSGPASLAGADTSDLLVQQGVDVQAGSAALPYNVDKASEYGRDNALAPPEGAHVKPTELASASTLSEASQSAKTGSRAPTGRNATIAPLE